MCKRFFLFVHYLLLNEMTKVKSSDHKTDKDRLCKHHVFPKMSKWFFSPFCTMLCLMKWLSWKLKYHNWQLYVLWASCISKNVKKNLLSYVYHLLLREIIHVQAVSHDWKENVIPAKIYSLVIFFMQYTRYICKTTHLTCQLFCTAAGYCTVILLQEDNHPTFYLQDIISFFDTRCL